MEAYAPATVQQLGDDGVNAGWPTGGKVTEVARFPRRAAGTPGSIDLSSYSLPCLARGSPPPSPECSAIRVPRGRPSPILSMSPCYRSACSRERIIRFAYGRHSERDDLLRRYPQASGRSYIGDCLCYCHLTTVLLSLTFCTLRTFALRRNYLCTTQDGDRVDRL